MAHPHLMAKLAQELVENLDFSWEPSNMSAETFSQKFVKDTDEMPQASNQNCNTMASNICWPKIVRTKLDKAYLNQN